MPPDTTSAPICIVDDDLSLGRALSRLLRSVGICSRAFTDPREFLQYAEANPVPLAILDVMMPWLSGLEVQQRLRQIAPETAVIVLTGRSDPATCEAAIAGGARGYFRKPFDDEVLLAVIRDVLQLPANPQ